MLEPIRTNTILNGRYLVQKELGQGGMGAVYLAQDMQNRRPVAIKVARLLGPEARDQFQREAVYLQKLHHHSLPRVWDYFSDTQRDFLVMEYIPGEDLETLVQRKGAQPEWLVLRWSDELLDGLEYLHGQTPPIVHRDVKPGNLKLRQDETLVLVDFGIAREYAPGSEAQPGANAVTPGFSPLEQYSDIATDARTDIYAVGATMYFLLTARIPPPAPERASGDKKLLPPSQIVPDISAGTEMVTRKALGLARDERWASATEMRRTLAQAAQLLAAKESPPKTNSFKVPGPPPPSTPVSAAGSGGRRSAGRVALVALAAVAVLAVAALVWSSGALKPGGVTAEPSRQPVAQTTSVSPAEAAASAPTAPGPAAPTVAMGAGPVSTPMPTHTPSPVPLVAPTSTPLGAVAADGIPTSTPIPTRTPTPAKATPTVTSAPARRTSVATAAATASLAPTASLSVPSVSLAEPAAGAAGGGDRVFRWQAASPLQANQAFELVFWKPGQDAVRDGFGLAGTTQGGQAQVNLDALDDALAQLEPGDYLWGVLLVEQSSYRRIALASDARAFRYERTSAADDGGSDPDPTPPF